MKHPLENDFDTSVTEAGVTVTFKPTNSIYSFYRLADTDDTVIDAALRSLNCAVIGMNT
jgi:hypothetical protein